MDSVQTNWRIDKDVKDHIVKQAKKDDRAPGVYLSRLIRTNHMEPEPPTKDKDKTPGKVKATKASPKDINHIFSYWTKVMGKNSAARLTKKRIRAITARLDEGYAVEQIKHAIDGCKKSGFHQGLNDTGRKYNDIELICRDGVKLESFWHQSATLASRSRTLDGNVQAAKDFMEKKRNE